MIVLDTETTNLSAPEAAPLAQQPHITELVAAKLDDQTLEEVDRISFLINPLIPIPEEAQKITGITDAMVAGQPPFSAHYISLAEFFLGERMLVAHNLYYDRDVLTAELRRIGKLTAFPWPWRQVCTVEATAYLRGFRLSLSRLHELATGVEHKEAHRAGADVDALITCVRWMRSEGIL